MTLQAYIYSGCHGNSEFYTNIQTQYIYENKYIFLRFLTVFLMDKMSIVNRTFRILKKLRGKYSRRRRRETQCIMVTTIFHPYGLEIKIA